jgi:peptidoglycan/LPS O-acetylase OafA/YrhL
MHIVVGHMYQSGYGGMYMCSWGFSWVPWFFMLSGYVLTLARHASKYPEAPQSVVTFVQKRAAVIYPPYAVSLFVGLAQLWWEGEALPKFYHLAAQGVLAQSFVPWLPENTVQVCHFQPRAAGGGGVESCGSAIARLFRPHGSWLGDDAPVQLGGMWFAASALCAQRPAFAAPLQAGSNSA